jgi:outer membrane lipoprotein-sorting protein
MEHSMNPIRRRLVIGIAATPFAGLPAFGQSTLSASDRALVDRAVVYLEGLAEAQARFTQTDARGRRQTGTVYLKRPGKARFAYDAPSGLLVVSNGRLVAVQDQRLKSFDQYPLSATPLSLFLARTIRLDQGVQVTSVQRMAGGFSITARDTRRQTAGEITLSFADDPLALSGWTVVDAQRRATRVQLQGLQRAQGLSASLFELKDPRPRTPGRSKS